VTFPSWTVKLTARAPQGNTVDAFVSSRAPEVNDHFEFCLFFIFVAQRFFCGAAPLTAFFRRGDTAFVLPFKATPLGPSDPSLVFLSPSSLHARLSGCSIDAPLSRPPFGLFGVYLPYPCCFPAARS